MQTLFHQVKREDVVSVRRQAGGVTGAWWMFRAGSSRVGLPAERAITSHFQAVVDFHPSVTGL